MFGNKAEPTREDYIQFYLQAYKFSNGELPPDKETSSGGHGQTDFFETRVT